MNREIEQLFNDFNVDGVDIPIAFIRYRGDLKTFITYHEIDNQPRVEADNKPIYSVSEFDFDIYTDGNYLNIVSEVKKILINNDYVWIDDSPDMFEEDTRLYHKTITFAKERSVI